MIKPVTFLAVTTLLCLSVSINSFGQSREMFSWTDENGVVHFSDTRPQGQDVRVIAIPEPQEPEPQEPPASPPQQAPDTPVQLTAAQQRREDIAQRKRETREAAAEKKAKCDAMNAELAQIEPNRRVYFTNEQGETERMDDVVRTDRVAELRDMIKIECQ